MKILFYAYKSWGHDPIWHFPYPCRKFRVWTQCYAFSELPKYKIHQKMPMFEHLKNQILVNSNFFWPLIRKILMWTFYGVGPYHPLPSAIWPQGVFGKWNFKECSIHFFRGSFLSTNWELFSVKTTRLFR